MVRWPAAVNEVEADVIDLPRYHEQREHGVFVDGQGLARGDQGAEVVWEVVLSNVD